ncbi:MAG: aminotransferase class III-fold pyridoxal phosphate-dependent enzyme, partial [Pseudomonadota bacterium]
DLLEDVRGVGMLMGMKAKVLNLDIVAAMRDNGLLVVGAGNNVIRVLPPLVVTHEDISVIREKMIQSLDQVRAAQNG